MNSHEQEKQTILDLITRGTPVYAACDIAGLNQNTLNSWLRRGKKSKDDTDEYRLFVFAYQKSLEQGLRLRRKKAEERRADPQNDAEPITNRHNPVYLSLFTEETRKRITGNLSKGGSLLASSESEKVPIEIAQFWLRMGRQAFANNQLQDEFCQFYLNTIQSMGLARLSSEISVKENQPLSFLLFGPVARESGDGQGWTRTQNHVVSVQSHTKIITSWGGTSVAGTPPSLPEYYPGNSNANGNGHIVEAGIPALIGPEADEDTQDYTLNNGNVYMSASPDDE